nr:transposase [Nocardiopsis sp. B62]
MQVTVSISQGRLSSATDAALQLAQEPHPQGVPRGRPVGAHRGAAALPGRPCAARTHHRATNKVESYNGFSQWLRFSNGGVLADNDPVEQEKLIKLNTLSTAHRTAVPGPPHREDGRAGLRCSKLPV